MLQPGLRGKRLLQRQDGGVMSGALARPWSLSIRLEGLVLGQASFLGSVTVGSFFPRTIVSCYALEAMLLVAPSPICQ